MRKKNEVIVEWQERTSVLYGYVMLPIVCSALPIVLLLTSNNIWLRDHCRCPECFHSVTRQRLANTFDLIHQSPQGMIELATQHSGND